MQCRGCAKERDQDLRVEAALLAADAIEEATLDAELAAELAEGD